MKPKDTQKIHREHKKLGKPKKLNKQQLEKLVKHFKVKYCFTLEEVIVAQQQDIHHLRNSNRILHLKIQSDTKIIEDHKKGIANLIDKYEDIKDDLEKQLQECNSKRADITRAYNGLHSLGKFAEEQGIDIKTASEELPESEKNKYDFSQKHTVLESGKVKHSWTLKPKKNGEGK
jgi:DNA-directed RNA polymerase subunit L